MCFSHACHSTDMRRGHSDDDGGAPNRGGPPKEYKTSKGKGRAPAPRPVPVPPPDPEPLCDDRGGSSSRYRPEEAPVSRVTRSRTTQIVAVKRGMAFALFLGMPFHVFQFVACKLPLSRLLMLRCTSKVVLNMFLENETDGDERMLLWHIACTCLTVSIPAFVDYQPLLGMLSVSCRHNADCLFHVRYVGSWFFRGESIQPMDGQVVRFLDLFPSSGGNLPYLLSNWVFACAYHQLHNGVPADTVATLRHAGFFCTRRNRERLIRAIRPLLKCLSRLGSDAFHPELLPVYSFMMELATESYGISYVHVDSRLWVGGLEIQPIADRGGATRPMVDVRREDVNRLNTKYGLHLRFDP